MHTSHHIFFSYCRRDNGTPVNHLGEGWVTAFEREIRARRRAYSGRDLRIFLDKESIETGTDLAPAAREGIRDSRRLRAFSFPKLSFYQRHLSTRRGTFELHVPRTRGGLLLPGDFALPNPR